MLIKRKTVRERFLAAMESIVARGEEPTLHLVAAETKLAYSTIYAYSGLLEAYYGGSRRPDKDEVKARVALVRAAKVRHAALGGLDPRTLSEILPD